VTLCGIDNVYYIIHNSVQHGITPYHKIG